MFTDLASCEVLVESSCPIPFSVRRVVVDIRRNSFFEVYTLDFIILVVVDLYESAGSACWEVEGVDASGYHQCDFLCPWVAFGSDRRGE